jgi:hypothetical protein
MVDISRVLILDYQTYQTDIYKEPTSHDSINTKSFLSTFTNSDIQRPPKNSSIQDDQSKHSIYFQICVAMNTLMDSSKTIEGSDQRTDLGKL